MPATKTKKLTLSESVQRLYLHSMQSRGPEDALMGIEESLTGDEYDAIVSFEKWLKSTKRTFGWNIAEVVKDWEKGQ